MTRNPAGSRSRLNTRCSATTTTPHMQVRRKAVYVFHVLNFRQRNVIASLSAVLPTQCFLGRELCGAVGERLI